MSIRPSRSLPYPNAIPVLEKHLIRHYSDTTLETLARALAVPDSRNIWKNLVDIYCKTSNYDQNGKRLRSKDGLALALAAAVTPTTLNELTDLLFDTANGESRIFLLAPLRRSKSQYVQEAVQKLASDPVLTKEINSWKKEKK